MTNAEKKELFIEAWKNIFEVDTVNDDDNFFEVGGDSLKGVQLVGWLIQKGLKLDMLKIYTAPTVAELAEALEETQPMEVPQELLTKENVERFMQDPVVQKARMKAEQSGGPGFGQPPFPPQGPNGQPPFPPQGPNGQPPFPPQAPNGQQLCTPPQGANGQQLCTPPQGANGQQLCTPPQGANGQQLCTPPQGPNAQQLCTPPMGFGQPMGYMPPMAYPQPMPMMVAMIPVCFVPMTYMMPMNFMPPMQGMPPMGFGQPQQLCTPPQGANGQQLCTPPAGFGQPGQNGAGLSYMGFPTDAPVENPNIVKVNEPKLGTVTRAPEDALDFVLNGIFPNGYSKQDNLLSQGMTSLQMMQLITRAAEQGYRLKIEDVIKDPTFSGIVNSMKTE